MGLLDTVEPHYIWIAIGLFLGAAEILVPGMFLLWLALAALITGFAAWILPIGVPLQIVIFSALSIVTVFIGRNYLRRHPVTEADPMMNKRGARLVGETALLVQPIVGGSGRVKLGDSEWIARGPDTAQGVRVRITGAEGAILLVEPIAD